MKILLFSLVSMVSAEARPWTDDVIYLAMADRFCDGDPANNVPGGCDPALFDAKQKDIGRHHGGDLRGGETPSRPAISTISA